MPRARRGLWIAAFLHGINRFVVAGVLYATMGLLVQDRLPFNSLGIGVATATGMLIAGRTVFSMASAPLAGAVSDWLGSRWGVVRWGLVIGSVSLSLITLRAPLAILIGIILGAMTSASMQTLITALVGDLADSTQRGRAIARWSPRS